MIYSFKEISGAKTEYGFALEIRRNWGCFKEITEEEHAKLFAGQSSGKVIKFKEDATPYLAEPEPEKTKKELFDEGQISKEEYNVHIDKLREAAYRIETDPLGMQVLRGDIEREVWLEKIAEIKKRYPKVD